MIRFLWFMAGLSLGLWMNNPANAHYGSAAGKWTRAHILGLPPINQIEGERK